MEEGSRGGEIPAVSSANLRCARGLAGKGSRVRGPKLGGSAVVRDPLMPLQAPRNDRPCKTLGRVRGGARQGLAGGCPARRLGLRAVPRGGVMIISFPLRRSGPPAIAGTHCEGEASPVRGCGLYTPTAATSTCTATDARPVTGTARPASARRGRRQTPGHRDPDCGFTARGVGGAWI